MGKLFYLDIFGAAGYGITAFIQNALKFES